MDEPTKEQIAKLPVWAKNHITRLERSLAEVTRRIDSIENEQEPTEFYYEIHDCERPYGGPTFRKIYLPKYCTPSCEIGGIKLSVYIRDGDIEISLGGMAAQAMAIAPVASNCVRILEAKRLANG